MDNTTPAAPAPASDATPNTNSNPAPAASTEPQTTVTESKAPVANVPSEQVEAFNKFVEANGGFDKAFGKMKQTISNPQAQPPTQASDVAQQPAEPKAPAVEPSQASQPPAKPAEGFITPNEYFAQKLNEDLAAKYPEISDYIKKAEYLKDGTAWGMTLVDQAGNMNIKVINEFLEMKAKSVAPNPASTPVTTIPTVEYTNTEGDITSQDIAYAILKQGDKHPRFKEAQNYISEKMFGKRPEPKQK